MIRFKITQNDADGDTLTWWEEVNKFGTDPTIKNDRYAVLVAGWTIDDEHISNHLYVTNNLYSILRADGIGDDHHCFHPRRACDQSMTGFYRKYHMKT